MFESLKKKRSVERIIDEKFYEAVALEMNSGVIRTGLWAKATVHANGNESQIEALYIQYRVQALFDEMRVASTVDLNPIQPEKVVKSKPKLSVPKKKTAWYDNLFVGMISLIIVFYFLLALFN